MKKNYLLMAFAFFSTTIVFSQTVPRITMNFNSVTFQINGKGFYGLDPVNNVATYRVPQENIAKPLYCVDPGVLAKDINGQDYAAMSEYANSDFSVGPIANSYSDATYISKYNKLWRIYQWMIDDHIEHFADQDYTIHPELLDWPANGNTANGEAAILAPFKDLNGNGVYEPELGEYPEIRGHFAVYSIINDQAAAGYFGNQRPGVEIHTMYYCFVSDNSINSTTFVHATVYNRSSATYNDFQYGLVTDFDLGNHSDDYTGTDIDRNLAYVYNAYANDETYMGSVGYGWNPPAFGLVALNGDLYAHSRNDTAIAPLPRFKNMMNGMLPDGTAMLDGGGQATRYTFPGNYTEASIASIPGDRKSVISFNPQQLSPGSSTCYDYALIYARKANTGPMHSVDSLRGVADFVQNFYDNQEFACGNGTLSNTKLSQKEITIYPNPASNLLNIKGISNADFTITGMDGRNYASGKTSGFVDVNALSAGMYILSVEENGVVMRGSFVKE